MTHRSRQSDLIAFALLLVGFVLAVSIFSHDPADLPGTTVYPRNAEPTNLLGSPGAVLADTLIATLGDSVYLLLASWFVLVLCMFNQSDPLTWILRSLGWLLMLPCAAYGLDQLPAGRGGTLGAYLTLLLNELLQPPGVWLILISTTALSLVLALDFVVVRLASCARNAGQWSASQAAHALATLFQRRPRPLESSGTNVVERPKSDINPAQTLPSTTQLVMPSSIVVPIRRPTPAPAQESFVDFELPPLDLLDDTPPVAAETNDQHLLECAVLLEKTFLDFGFSIKVVGINTGPVITQYEIALETGLRVNKITGLADDLSINLKVPSVRIVAPIPGKNTVGIEIPNEHRAVVRLKKVILTYGKKIAKAKIPLFLGEDTQGQPLVYDLAEMPHLLIAGRTGTGKSVCMNAIILSMLMTRRPDEVKMIMIDPKMLEMSEYGKIPHLMHPVVKDMKKAEAILAWAVDKMEERYELLSRARVRNIAGYNELGMDEIVKRVRPEDEESKRALPEKIPYIVIFVDEMADLMMTSKKEVETHIIRLAQKSRAAGIHLVVATQKPTVDVITGLIKSNLPARICFQVSSRIDSRVVLDENGADKLLGKGDMLFLVPNSSQILRAQGTFSSDQEITRVVQHIECDNQCFAEELVQLKPGGTKDGSLSEKLKSRDDMYEQAIDVVVREQRGSVSLLQRALGIGYGRAARLIDYMAEDGIVGPYNGSNARDVLIPPERWDDMRKGA